MKITNIPVFIKEEKAKAKEKEEKQAKEAKEEDIKKREPYFFQGSDIKNKEILKKAKEEGTLGKGGMIRGIKERNILNRIKNDPEFRRKMVEKYKNITELKKDLGAMLDEKKIWQLLTEKRMVPNKKHRQFDYQEKTALLKKEKEKQEELNERFR